MDVHLVITIFNQSLPSHLCQDLEEDVDLLLKLCSVMHHMETMMMMMKVTKMSTMNKMNVKREWSNALQGKKKKNR